jgi:hypothetical protein
VSETKIGWFTTMPNTRLGYRHHTHGADDGQIGWKLHAVPVDDQAVPEKKAQALCGLRPRHGWGMDLFIEDECSRCAAAMEKREKAGDTFIDQQEVRSAAQKAAEYAKFLAEREKEL